MENLKVDLFDEEVFVFTPKGEVKSLAAGATPLDFAYEIHTELGHRCVGAKVNGKIVPLNYQLQVGRHRRGPHLQARARPVARLAGARQDHPRAQQDQAVVQAGVARGHRAHRPRAAAGAPQQGRACRPRRSTGSPLLADVIREMGFRKADDFYIALGGAKISPKVVVNKVLQRLKQGEAAEEEATTAESLVSTPPPAPPADRLERLATASASRASTTSCCGMAKCCRPVPGDPIVGYVSLGPRHHDPPRRLPQHRRAAQGPRALRAASHWEGDHETAFKVELQVDAWDRHRLLEDLSRTFAEAGHQHRRGPLHRLHPMVQNRFVVEVGRHAGAQADDHAPAQHRLGVRRVPGDAGGGVGRRSAALSWRQFATGAVKEGGPPAGGWARNRANRVRFLPVSGKNSTRFGPSARDGGDPSSVPWPRGAARAGAPGRAAAQPPEPPDARRRTRRSPRTRGAARAGAPGCAAPQTRADSRPNAT